MNKFDRILWRINGVLFLVILMFGIFPLVWSLTESFRSRPYRQVEPRIVNKPQGTNDKEFLHLGDASRVRGTPFLRLSLRSEAQYSLSSKGRDGRIANYLYLDNGDLSSWWLFDGFDRLISQVHDLRAEGGGNDKPVIATLFEVISTDTDGDHRLTTNDREAIYFSGPDGKKPIEIIPPTDGILSVEQVAPMNVLVIYQRDQVVTAGLFSTKDGSKVKESKLPIQQNP
jgi:hypothetical protein